MLLLYATHFVDCEILCPGMISAFVYGDYSRNIHVVANDLQR